MQLTLWTYEGPPHVGAMRVATAMQDVHYVLHAPQGDTYADLLFTMIERRSKRPPVTYTTFQAAPRADRQPGQRPRCNLLGPTALGFRHRDDVTEITQLLHKLGVDVHVTAPLDATVADIARLPEADFNVVLYPEVASVAASWLAREHGMPMVKTVPLGMGATREFILEVAALAGLDAAAVLNDASARAPWYARSVDSTYLTGKRVFVFGDATHAVAAARIAAKELGFEVVGLGTYSREFAREVREAAKLYGVEALITDDYLEVEARIAELNVELVLGTQMERHIAKRLKLPCAVISAPVHVQDFPARYSPQMGFEGANVLFDSWVHPLMMGLEEHLIGMFRRPRRRAPAAGNGIRGRSLSPQPGRIKRGTAAAGHRRSLGRGCAERAAEDPVLRARQGTTQHRTLCR